MILRRPLAATATVALATMLMVAPIAGEASGPDAPAHAPVAKADRSAGRLALRARAKLSANRSDMAIALAERAVALSPGNAEHRALLGQAYLSAGRFASAAAALRESLQLSPDQPKARFAQALAEIGIGHGDAAVQILSGLRGRVADADLGLALAMAGDREAGIAVLTEVVRAGRSDARTRQNLALAYALDGRWGEARGMAMQDTTPDRIRDQFLGWAAIAGPGKAPQQVAAMFGAHPAASDPGIPQRLALAMPVAQARVALAAAQPLPPIIAVPPPLPPAVIVDATPMPAIAVAAVEPRVPAFVAAQPAPLLRRVSLTPRAVAPGPEIRTVAGGGWVVQIGAFASARAAAAAWSETSRVAPHVATLSPIHSRTNVAGATLLRLSIGAFATRGEATATCVQIKARGRSCFVRRTAGDAPMRWAGADRTGRAA